MISQAVVRAALVAACVLLAACTAPENLLNSERIAARFGNYAVNVLAQDSQWRLSSLESHAQGVATTRTLAVVHYVDPVPAALRPIHEQILAGASLGASFKRAGWTVLKTHLDIGQVELKPTDHLLLERMRLSVNVSLGLHIYRLDAARNGQRLAYATIAELHHPEYLQEPELHRLYGFAQSADSRARVLAALQRLLASREDNLVR